MKIYLEKYRIEKRLSTRKLSSMTGIARSHIIKIEAGEANPTALVLCRLSKALKISISDLIDCE